MTDVFSKASRDLESMEQFSLANKDEDDIVPTPEVFASVREFLKALTDECKGIQIPQLKFFDSNGAIILYVGERPHHIIITFSPELTLTFVCWPRHDGDKHRAGEGLANVLNIIKERGQST